MYNAHQQQKRENKASRAASKATLRNIERQKQQGQRSRELFAEAVPQHGADTQRQNLEQAAATRETAMKANLGPATGDYAPTPSSSPKVVGAHEGKAKAAGRAKVDKEAAALALLGGWGDTQQDNRIGLNRAGGQIRENNSFVQGTANLLPMEQNTAVNKVYSKPLSPWGDIAQTAGAAGTMYFWPQADPLTFADTLGMPRSKRKSPRTGLGEVRG